MSLAVCDRQNDVGMYYVSGSISAHGTPCCCQALLLVGCLGVVLLSSLSYLSAFMRVDCFSFEYGPRTVIGLLIDLLVVCFAEMA